MMKTEPPGILSALGIAIICCNRQGLISFLNHKAEVLIGATHLTAFGSPVSDVVGFEFEKEITRTLIRFEARQTKTNPCAPLLTHEIFFPPQDLTFQACMIPAFNAVGVCDGFAIALYPQSAKDSVLGKGSLSGETWYRANFDLLTGLPNSFLISDRIHIAMSLAKRQNTQIGLLFLDLDGFKLINDSLGHLAGDKLLQSVAKRLSNCVRSSDCVGRYGGDEFLILLNEVNSLRDCEQVAYKILSSFHQPHRLANKSIVTTASIGISTFPGDADSEESLIEHADKAMYLAKKTGRNKFEFYK